MKVKTVSYQKVFPLGQFINERIGVECEVNELENPATILQEAKLMVEKFHKDSNPQIYSEELDIASNTIMYSSNTFGLPIPPEEGYTQKKDPKEEASQRMIDAINSCTELKVLESFKLLVKNNPDFQKAYDEKLKTFQ